MEQDVSGNTLNIKLNNPNNKFKELEQYDEVKKKI